MTCGLPASGLVERVKKVASGEYGGKALFYWEGTEDCLRTALSETPDIASASKWLDVSGLAEDVIPRLARDRLHARLKEVIDRAAEDGRSVLIVTNPYLLLRYEAAAPLGTFWDTFVASRRAVVVVLPCAARRPHGLPGYVQFRGETLRQLLLGPGEQSATIAFDGGYSNGDR